MYLYISDVLFLLASGCLHTKWGYLCFNFYILNHEINTDIFCLLLRKNNCRIFTLGDFSSVKNGDSLKCWRRWENKLLYMYMYIYVKVYINDIPQDKMFPDVIQVIFCRLFVCRFLESWTVFLYCKDNRCESLQGWVATVGKIVL